VVLVLVLVLVWDA